MVFSLPASTKHIGVHLSQQYAEELENNGMILLSILKSIRYLARQGLALRGDGDESDGNFNQLLKLPEDEKMIDWLKRKCNKYTSHDIQNELLKLHILRDIACDLQDSPFLTIMIDETTDISNLEQVTVVM